MEKEKGFTLEKIGLEKMNQIFGLIVLTTVLSTLTWQNQIVCGVLMMIQILNTCIKNLY